jgi:uncharacterized membrane protein
MGKGRLEAFSDGVIAIIITIMVLELKVPHGDSLADLKPLIPVLLSYVLSFLNLGIYWTNHHHLLHTITQVSGKVLWANLLLLFWLSLIPAATAWMGENHFAATPVAVYGFVLMMSGASYYILQQHIIATQGPKSLLRAALGADWKGKMSVLIYVVAVPLAFIAQWAALSLYVVVALLWFIPDRRIERKLASDVHAD